MPPQNIPLWNKDYFEPKAIRKQQIQKAVFPPTTCLKVGHKLPFVKVFPVLSAILGEQLITGDRKLAPRWSTQTNFTKGILPSISFLPYVFLPIIYHPGKPNPFSFVLSHLHNLSPFVKVAYRSLGLTSSLGLHLFSVKASVQIKTKMLTIT